MREDRPLDESRLSVSSFSSSFSFSSSSSLRLSALKLPEAFLSVKVASKVESCPGKKEEVLPLDPTRENMESC